MTAAPPSLFTAANGVGSLTDKQLNSLVQAGALFANLRKFTGLGGMCVWVIGGVSAFDGLQGLFAFSPASTAPDDNANCIAPSGAVAGRWLRQISTAVNLFFPTIASLRANAATPAAATAFIEGYYASADGGEGFFAYKSTDHSTADNGGTVIVDAGGNRWFRDLCGADPTVKQFGAHGNGTADDTVPFQAALNACLTVHVTPGSYSVRPLTISSDRLFYGDGPASLLVARTSGLNVYVIENAATTTANVTIRDMEFQGVGGGPIGGAVTFAGTDSVHFCANIKLENLTATNFFIGIRLYACLIAWVTDCFTAGCTFGFNNDMASDTVWGGCIATGGADYGFNIFNTNGTPLGDRVDFVNCSTNGQAGGLSAFHQSETTVSDATFIGCSLSIINLVQCTNWQITGGQVSGVTSPFGIFTNQQCVGIQVVGVQVTGVAGVGVQLGGSDETCSGCTFSGNPIDIRINAPIGGLGGVIHQISNNVCASTPTSIDEVTGADVTLFIGNLHAGAINKTGANSALGTNLLI